MSVCYIDVSTALKSGLGPPSGIPRLEREIVLSCLRQATGNYRYFFYDKIKNKFEIIERADIEGFIALSSPEVLLEIQKQALGERIRWAFRTVLNSRARNSKDLHRHVAQIAVKSETRTGWRYNVVKDALRVSALAATIFRLPFAVTNSRRFSPQASDTVLMSILTACDAIGKGGISTNAALYTLVHDAVPLDMPQYTVPGLPPKFRLALEDVMHKSYALISVSHHTAARMEFWRDQFRINRALPVHVLPVASPLSSTMRTGVPVESLAGERFVLFCSTIEPRKNHMLLLRIWREQIRGNGSAWPRLVFCGRWGWLFDEVQEMLKAEHALRERVTVLNEVSDEELIWCYRNALFTVFPSFEEGWGLGASEAMDFGNTVLVSDIPALREATQNLMPAIPVDDDALWTATLHNLITKPEALAALRARLQDYVPRSCEEMTARLQEILAHRA